MSKGLKDGARLKTASLDDLGITECPPSSRLDNLLYFRTSRHLNYALGDFYQCLIPMLSRRLRSH